MSARPLPNPRADHRSAAHLFDLRRRVTALRMEIAAAERKRGGIEAAIDSRRGALNRLLAQLALCECGAASSHDA
jgi:hypothetical protein